MKNVIKTTAVIGCVLGPLMNSQAALVVPTAAETQMGNNGIQTAFYFRPGSQYFYDASLFSGPVEISGFSIRMMQGSAISGNTSTLNFQILLSTTSATATSLNTTTPSLNHGANLAEVKNSPLSIVSGSTLNGDGVTDWSTPINFDTPFVFDPAEGSLLMEFGGNSPNGVFNTHFVDGWEVDGAGLARVNVFNGGGGFFTDQLGAIVQFNTTPIPEPSGVLLAGLTMGFGFMRRR